MNSICVLCLVPKPPAYNHQKGSKLGLGGCLGFSIVPIVTVIFCFAGRVTDNVKRLSLKLTIIGTRS